VADFAELRVYQLSLTLVEICYAFAETLPAGEARGLQSQLRRAAASIPSNIAEGSGRVAPKDFRRFIRIAYGSACETQSHALLAKAIGYGSPDDADVIIATANTIRRMLSGLSSSLNT
jgi:four helix bundle protein